jgi:predicted thioesterase
MEYRRHLAPRSGSPYIGLVKNEIAPGIGRRQSDVTTMEMRAKQLKAAVFSTPAMIGLMERTCVDLTVLSRSGRADRRHSRGCAHLAPTQIGQTATRTAELLEVNDNKLRYAVSAVNDQGKKIGEKKPPPGGD